MPNSKQYVGGESCTTAALDQVLELQSEFNGTRYHHQVQKRSPILTWFMNASLLCIFLYVVGAYCYKRILGVDPGAMWGAVFCIPLFIGHILISNKVCMIYKPWVKAFPRELEYLPGQLSVFNFIELTKVLKRRGLLNEIFIKELAKSCRYFIGFKRKASGFLGVSGWVMLLKVLAILPAYRILEIFFDNSSSVEGLMFLAIWLVFYGVLVIRYIRFKYAGFIEKRKVKKIQKYILTWRKVGLDKLNAMLDENGELLERH